MRAPMPRAAALAEQQGLGGYVAGAKGANPVVEGVSALFVAGLLFLLAWGATWLTEATSLRALALLVLLLAIAGLAVTGYGFFRMFQPFRAICRFERGVVWTVNGRPQAATWHAVDEMFLEVRNGKGPDGPVNRVGLVTTDGRIAELDTFGDQPTFDTFARELAAVATAHGRPVLRSRRDPGVREAVGVALGDRALAFLDVVVGGAVIAAVGAGLWRLGLPGPIAAVVAFVVVGTGVGLLGLRLDRRVAIHGGIFVAIGGLVLMVAAARALPQLNAYLVAGVVLAAEMAVLSVARTVFQRLPARRRSRERARLAAQQGWRFQETASVPVAGRHTAWNLIGVTPEMTGTTLHDVLVGTIDGVEVLVGDRFRRPPRRIDPVQTVWIARLPAELPMVTSENFVPNGAPAVDARQAQLIGLLAGGLPAGTVQINGRVHRQYPPAWWIEGAFLYVLSGSGDARNIVRWATTIGRYVAGLPWQDLRRQASLPSR